MDLNLTAKARAFTQRLDECLVLIAAAQTAASAGRNRPVLDDLKSQGLVYVGFLAEVLSGRFPQDAYRTMTLIERFCQLIETELPVDSNLNKPGDA
ncbi:hypothetical protein DFQ28_007590 [Apophysomyces sp. BC1034]|nr:hypothetical protein DFQ30_007200 [Apophysomyces sp. BC1015]KAG0186585.1 hypothetical protein DFQ28_007590 [Apophysomyces sp. BC1034]